MLTHCRLLLQRLWLGPAPWLGAYIAQELRLLFRCWVDTARELWDLLYTQLEETIIRVLILLVW